MLIFSTYLTVALFFAKETAGRNESSLPNLFFSSSQRGLKNLALLHPRNHLEGQVLRTNRKHNKSIYHDSDISFSRKQIAVYQFDLPSPYLEPSSIEVKFNDLQTDIGQEDKITPEFDFSGYSPDLDKALKALNYHEKYNKTETKRTQWEKEDNGIRLNLLGPDTTTSDKEEERLNQLEELFQLQNPAEEYEDEIHDAEIFRSIYTSVMFHRKNWVKRFFKRFLGHHRVKRDEEVVCYKDLGCFRDEGPFDYFDMLPNSPEEINTRFLLHTTTNPKREQYLSYTNASSILSSNFRPSRKTKVIIHGFGSSCYRVWAKEMRQTFLKMEDVNVICVHWEDGASTPNYVRAASNTRLVGAQVAVFLDMMARVTNTSLDDIHLVGFSLGAHVSGYAGQRLKGIGRISGLDPAGPLFESFPPNMRLDASDAKFVDVIHTNADSLLWGGLGAYDPMGHVDFYPNGGRVQKGCKNLFVGGVSDILWPKEGDGRFLCNHRRGYKYFMESVVPVCEFPAFACRDYETFLKGDCFPCKDCGNMGYYADKSPGRGQMFLVTRDTEPFCANQYKLEIWHSGGPPMTDSVSTQGRFDVTFVAPDGKNETIDVTRETGKKMLAGTRTVAIVVPHVALAVISNLQVTYTSHRGWLSSGFNRWAIDKLSIMSHSGKVQSFCHRGLTMESGLTMVFPLVPGDCNPRELTLHPLPVPWPGIDYSLQNGVHVYPAPPSSHNIPVDPAYNYNASFVHSVPHSNIQPQAPSHAHNPVLKPPQDISPHHSRPQTPSTSFSVIHDSPVSKLNTTEIPIVSMNGTRRPSPIHEHRERFNASIAKDEFNSSYVPMTEEEYIKWKDAPPPNLQLSYSEEKQRERLANKVSSDRLPVNVIPAPNLHKQSTNLEPSIQNDGSNVSVNKNNPTVRSHESTIRETPKSFTGSEFKRRGDGEHRASFIITKTANRSTVMALGDKKIIREDAQVTDLNSSNFKVVVNKESNKDKLYYSYHLPAISSGKNSPDQKSEPETPSTSHLADQNYDGNSGNAEISDIGVLKKITEELPYNSLIEGEVPFKERARAIKFQPGPNLGAFGEIEKSDIQSQSQDDNEKGKSSKLGQTNEGDSKISSNQTLSKDEKLLKVELGLQASNSNVFPSSHKLDQSKPFEKDKTSNRFSYEHYSVPNSQSFNTHSSSGSHTLPPTVLRPPSFNPKSDFKTDGPFHQPHPPRFPAHLNPAHYSNFYPQQHYFPKSNADFKPFETPSENGETFSESSYVPFFDTRDSLFLASDSPPHFVRTHHPPPRPFTPYTIPPTKAPKRLFNPFSILTSLTKPLEGRSKLFFGGRFFSQNTAPNRDHRLYPERTPYYLPHHEEQIKGHRSFRRFALPTHLQAPPLSQKPHIPPASIKRSLNLGDFISTEGKHTSKNKNFGGSEKKSSKPVRLPGKLAESSAPYSRVFVSSANKFIPVKLSRTSQMERNSRPR